LSGVGLLERTVVGAKGDFSATRLIADGEQLLFTGFLLSLCTSACARYESVIAEKVNNGRKWVTSLSFFTSKGFN
jgi:hypothetical protein